MQAHLQYWEAVIDKQDRLIAILLSSAAATTDLPQQLQAGGMQGCVTGRYLPQCHELAGDVRAREGAACVLQRAKQEAVRHLRLAQSAFQPYVTPDAAAAHASPMADLGAPGVDRPADVQPEEQESDDELAYSDDEGCEAVNLADCDSSDGSESSEDDC